MLFLSENIAPVHLVICAKEGELLDHSVEFSGGIRHIFCLDILDRLRHRVVDFVYCLGAVCISGNFWNKLTEEEQAWFQEAADLATEEERVHVQNVEQQFLDEMIETIDFFLRIVGEHEPAANQEGDRTDGYDYIFHNFTSAVNGTVLSDER